MVLRKSDLTEEALNLGLWDALLDVANVDINERADCDTDDIDIQITAAERN